MNKTKQGHAAATALKWVARAGAFVLAGGLIAANVGMALLGDTVNSFLGTDSVEIEPERAEAIMARGRALAERVEGEGLVLVRNEDGALPLPARTSRVNVFGWASTQWVASGSGSGQVAGQTMGILEALTEAGVEYNTELADMYRGFHGEREFAGAGALNSRDVEFCRLYEPSVEDKSCYSDDLLANAEAFSSTALVVIGRTAGESVDTPRQQYKVNAREGGVVVDATRTYLQLSREEEDLLAYVGEHYDRVVVLVNSTNAMELGQLETTPGVDAALLVGTTGEVGSRAVVSALLGNVNPSGRTTDTYAYDHRTAAAWANSGAEGEGSYLGSAIDRLYPADGTSNSNVGFPEAYDTVRFVDYAEGIYVGYRWYETADAEGFWDDVDNQYGTGYQGVVQYPFGFGLSYTSFEWEVLGAMPNAEWTPIDRNTRVSVSVRVTNTGSLPGRDVVQLYCSAPYQEGQVEKSATVLTDFAKTRLLAPGESQDVSLSFVLDDVASFDAYDANGNGFAGYELDGGSYVVELRRNAHERAACEGASITYWMPYDQQCADDLVTGAAVTPRFTGETAAYGVPTDGSADGEGGAAITFLSRADFAGTFAQAESGDRVMGERVAALNLYDADQVAADAAAYAAATEGQGSVSLNQPLTTMGGAARVLSRDGQLTGSGVTLGRDYNNSLWEYLISGLSVTDMERLVLHGYLATGRIDAIGKPLTKEVDGPAQVGSFNQLQYGVGYPNPTVLAQTWDRQLAREYGQQVGLECAVIGVDGWYAPCVNVHRTPSGGRNYEYYSEDPLVCGEFGAQVQAGSREAGTYCFIKHFAVNNQDSYRDSLYTWLTEQALREVYLAPFRRAVRAGATGFMSSYNRVGAVWAGGNRALLTDVLRGEWGFEGCVITDYADHHAYMNADQMLRAGGSLFMDGVFRNGALAHALTQTQMQRALGTEGEAAAADYLVNLRRASKDILYVWLDARVTNLDYNAAAAEKGAEPIDRPVKRAGFNYVGGALAVADAVACLGAIAWIRRRGAGRD